MIALKIIGVLYLITGVVYSVYVHAIGSERKWWLFPINVIGGPIMVVYLIILSVRRKRLPVDWQ